MDKNKNKNYKKEHKHHHHLNRQKSIPEKLNLKNYKINDNSNKIYKNSQQNNSIKNSSIRESHKIEQKEHKHHQLHHNRSTSLISSKKEKDYMRYKLENFGRKKEKTRYILQENVNNNIPKNIDKNTEKYFKQKLNNLNEINNKKNEKEKGIDINREKYNNKYQSTYINENNNKKRKNVNDEYIFNDPENINNNYGYKNDERRENKNKEKCNTQFNEDDNYFYKNNIKNNNIKYTNYIETNNNKENQINKTDKKRYFRDSIVNDLNIKMKSKYFKNYQLKNDSNKNINKKEISLNQDNYNYNLKKNNEKEKLKEHTDTNIEEKIRKRGRKSSMKISSKYSEKMKSQIAEERKKIMMEQEFLEKRKKEINDLEEKEQKESFAQEHFIKTYLSNLTPYIDYGRIFARLPGGYLFLQNKLIYLDLTCTEEEFTYIYNKKNFYKSKNAKELCRKGIPIKYMKIFFKKLLNLENFKENYNLKYSMIIKNIEPKYLGDYVPYFYGLDKKKLKEVLPVHYLNEEGINELKTIMWLISDLVPKIEYCPLLIKICSILLIFLDKEETYEAMRTLIEMNYNPSEIYKLRWHFRFSIMENEKLVESIRVFLLNESSNMKNLFDFFKENELDPHLLIKDFCEGLFLNYLNFYGMLRFICIFIYEGSKSLYRFTYGILNYIYEEKLEEIKNNKNDLIHQIRKIINKITDYKKIIQDSFNLKVTRANNGYIKNNSGEDIEELEKPFEAPSIYNTENDIESLNSKIINKINEKEKEKKNYYLYEFYLPKIEPKSNILSTKEIIKLWSKLPNNMRHSDLVTIYSLSKKKINMKSIIELSKKYPQDYSILLIIETEQNELFGVILPQMLQETEENEYIQIDNCCLVNFRPKISIFKDVYSKGLNMLCCNKKGLWFCKQEVGDLFYIDGTLSEGRTNKNNTYFGPVILTCKANFLIKDLEIIVFVENNI